MKFRTDFVTNSSSSSFLVFNIKHPRLYEFLTELGIIINNIDGGEFSEGMEIILPTGEEKALYEEEGDCLPTPDCFDSISSWIVGLILSEIEDVYPQKEIDEYSEFTIALIELLNEKGILHFDIEDPESWTLENLREAFKEIDKMDKDIENAEIEFNTGFEGEICGLEYKHIENGRVLSIMISDYDDEEKETLDGLNVFVNERDVCRKDDDYGEDVIRVCGFIDNNDGILCNEIDETIDYIVTNTFDPSSEIFQQAQSFGIPIISANGLFRRFGDESDLDDDVDEIHDELFECTYEGDFYRMFHKYGIGNVTRYKI